MSNLPTAEQRLRNLCTELRALVDADSGDLGYYSEHRLRELVDKAKPGQRAESDVALQATLDAYARLLADLQAAADQYETAIPVAHARLIWQRFDERMPEPRAVEPYDASPLMDRVIASLRLLGVTGPAAAADVLDAAGTSLSPRERQYIMAQIGGAA